ncbi:MAG: hypothetical protein NZL83_03615 [Candidatus Absconditabacterales bacterium]|nr:hypothetical protein [Candidatus Absconditabacterales bacterium]
MRILVEHGSFLHNEIHVWDFDETFARNRLYHGGFLDYVKYEGQDLPDLLLFDDLFYNVFPVVCHDPVGRQWDKESVRSFVCDSLFNQGYADVLRGCGMWYIDTALVDGVFRQSPLGYSGSGFFRIICLAGNSQLRSRLSALPIHWRTLPFFPKSFFVSNFFSSLLGKPNFHVFCIYEDMAQLITIHQSTYRESYSINLGWSHIATMCDEQGILFEDVLDGRLSGAGPEIFLSIAEFIVGQWIGWMNSFICFGYDIVLCGGGVRIRMLIDVLQARLQQFCSYVLPFRYSTHYGSYDFSFDESRLIPFAAFAKYSTFLSTRIIFPF